MKKLLFLLCIDFLGLTGINAVYSQEPVKREIALEDDDDTDCDKSKFPDFKRNLRFTTSAIELSVSQYVDSLAKVYFHEMKSQLAPEEREVGYLDTLILSSTAHFFSDAGVELFSYGYIVHSDHSDFEPGEASFYLIGVKQKGEIISMEVFHDIDGAMTLQLLGFEFTSTKDGAVFWGKVDGLFLDEYGRFKLLITSKMRLCLYECKNESGEE